MKDNRNIFKRCVSNACSVTHVQFGKFASERGLNDFEIDTFSVDRHPNEIATLAIDQLCIKDKGPMDRVVCLAVVDFLDKTIGVPREDDDRYLRLRALADILVNPGTYEAYLQWAESWYG